MMKVVIKEKYEAQGFVEALIAILITGIASIALMQISASTIRTVVDNEVYDQLTYEAVKGASMVRYAADYVEQGETEVPGFDTMPVQPSYLGNCYALDGDLENPINPVDNAIDFTTGILDYDQVIGEHYKIDVPIIVGVTDPNFFRVICYDRNNSEISNTEGEMDVIVAKIYTGFRSCSGSGDSGDENILPDLENEDPVSGGIAPVDDESITPDINNNEISLEDEQIEADQERADESYYIGPPQEATSEQQDLCPVYEHTLVFSYPHVIVNEIQ